MDKASPNGIPPPPNPILRPFGESILFQETYNKGVAMNPGLLNRKAEGVFSWSCRYWRRWSILGFTFALISPSTTQADVTIDGTMGPRGTLPGPNFRIGAEVGKRAGHNLFHSFGRFNVNTGESATFTGPAAVDNVISRVTGSSRSLINGPLRSEIQSANLWFINPNGVLFGKNA